MSKGKIVISNFVSFIESKENQRLDHPHIIPCDPPMKMPSGIKRLAEAFKKSKEVPIAKEIDTKAGGEKEVTLKAKKLFIVGGAVRDYLLGHTPKNYNLATDAHPEEVAKILYAARPAIKVTKQDIKKGITKVSVDGEEYEIHTLRKKSEEGEDIFTTNPAEDCEGRDFTINAMYYDVIANKIFDYCGGLRHLKDGNIKTIGKSEEKLKGIGKYRMMRFVNTVPGGKMDDKLKALLDKDEDDDLPPEKIREEFLKGLEHAHSNVKRYIKSYADSGLLNRVFPDLELSTDLPECTTCKNRVIILAFLLKENRPAKLVSKLKELKYSDREIKDAVYLINLLWFSPEHIYDFKRELVNTGLTKRQILDWVKLNKLDKTLITKLIDYDLQVNDENVDKFLNKEPEEYGNEENSLLNKMKELAYKAFI